MKALHGKRQDLTIVAVNIAINDSERRVRLYRKRFGLPFIVIYDRDHEITKTFGVRGTPTNVIIDKDGVIRYSGISKPKSLDALLGPLPAGTTPEPRKEPRS